MHRRIRSKKSQILRSTQSYRSKIAQLKQQLEQATQALENTQSELENARKMQGDFLSSVGHELRTPLSTIIGFSELMLENPDFSYEDDLHPDYKQDLRKINDSSKDLLNVINDLLDLARLNAGKLDIHMQEIDLEALLEHVMINIQARYGQKPIHFIYQTPPKTPSVWASQARLWQVLMHLYQNALTFTSRGSITLKIDEGDNDLIQFSISDTGSGIPPRIYNDLIQKFKIAETGNYPVNTYGDFSFAISYQLVQLMGGRLWFESITGKGSTFFFTLKKYTSQNNSR